MSRTRPEPPEPPPADVVQPISGPGAPGRTSAQIRADMERTRGELSQSVDLLRNRVAELSDWRGQLRQHQDQIVAGAAVLGFAVGALLVARRLRRRARRPERFRSLGLQQPLRDPAEAEQARADMGSDHRADLGDKDGVEPKTSRQWPTRIWAVSGSWMCWTTQASAPSSWRARAKSTIRSKRPPSRPHPLDRRDLLLEREDRLDLQGRAEEGLRGADPAALAQVLERVDREPHLEHVANLLDPGHHGLAVAAGGRDFGGPDREQAGATAGRAAVVDANPLAALALVDQALARLVR